MKKPALNRCWHTDHAVWTLDIRNSCSCTENVLKGGKYA